MDALAYSDYLRHETRLGSPASKEIQSLNYVTESKHHRGQSKIYKASNLSSISPNIVSDSIVYMSNDLLIASPDEQATYLRTGFWKNSLWNSRSFNLAKTDATGTGQQLNNTLIYDYDGFAFFGEAGTDLDGLTQSRRVFVDRVLQDISSKFGIVFKHRRKKDKIEDVDIFFKDNEFNLASTKYVLHSTGNSSIGFQHRYIDYACISIDKNWNNGSNADNDYTYQTFYHEILHALGLGHAGPYNSSIKYVTTNTGEENTNIYLNDSWQMSIMSYIDPVMNTWVPGEELCAITLMTADIQALRTYYGSGRSFLGNTIYGFNTNITEDQNYMLANLTSFAGTNMFCIVDDGGIDTFDFSGFTQNQWIDLSVVDAFSRDNSGGITSMSGVGGSFYNLSIAPNCVIENALTGSGNDGVIGNNADNRIVTGLGQDMIKGMGGRDVITTGGGLDLIGFDFGIADSVASSPDHITDFFYLADKLFIGNGPAPLSIERIANNNIARSTSALASFMFSGLGANQARICVSDNRSLLGRVYMAINDGSSMFSPNDDLFIQLSTLGGIPSVGAFSVDSIFNV